MDCEVCIEKFNLSTHKLVTCPYCPFKGCTTCHERYLCETTEDAHCMACHKGWSREILVDNFTQKFVTRTYKQRRENLLYERERSLMPATQIYVEYERKIRDLSRQIAALKADRERVHEKWMHIAHTPYAVIQVRDNLESEFDAIIRRHRDATDQRMAHTKISFDIEHLEYIQEQLMRQIHGTTLENEKRQFVRACPYTDCKGFLSTAWKCGVCDNWTCPECHEGKGPDKDAPHTCDPNSVATAQLLAKDSRNCPKCAASIFKIDGCDQMYCTQCHTAFSWRTGRVETGTIHNPHYYDYMRAHGGLPRNPGDVPCGGFPDLRTVLAVFSPTTGTGFTRGPQVPPERQDIWRMISTAHRMYGHCMWVVAPRYAHDRLNGNRDLRIKFMIGDLNEDEFKKKIQQREKAAQKKADLRQVCEMFTTVLNDLFQAYAARQTRDMDFVDSLWELRDHTNKTFTMVSKRYSGCATPWLDGTYSMY